VPSAATPVETLVDAVASMTSGIVSLVLLRLPLDARRRLAAAVLYVFYWIAFCVRLRKDAPKLSV
jgi:hypothetical protein